MPKIKHFKSSHRKISSKMFYFGIFMFYIGNLSWDHTFEEKLSVKKQFENVLYWSIFAYWCTCKNPLPQIFCFILGTLPYMIISLDHVYHMNPYDDHIMIDIILSYFHQVSKICTAK